ncbi:hypothetical protein V5E97_27730 [Singulisphaera sp. Ch08]|uniref:Uncharacterized protein n=1 Tax=Singulisphaera sp. Ch08 TaxID=3120278 RepID=A0AAU7CAA8_9BACT
MLIFQLVAGDAPTIKFGTLAVYAGRRFKASRVEAASGKPPSIHLYLLIGTAVAGSVAWYVRQTRKFTQKSGFLVF